jgi:hypothetical protein
MVPSPFYLTIIYLAEKISLLFLLSQSLLLHP